MRILVITPEQLPVPPVTGGSVETNTYNIFRRMARTDRVVLLSRAHPRLPAVSSMINGNLKIIRVPGGSRLRYIRAVLRKVRGQSFDVIQIENRPTFVPHVRRMFPRTPIILSLHSLTFMAALSTARANQILRKVNGVTSVVGYVTHAMRRRFPRYAHKFRTAILGVDTDKFCPRTASYKRQLRRRWGVSGTFNVLFVGRIVRMKGLDTLVRAVALLKRRTPRIRLVAVGASWPGVKRQTPYMRRVRLLSNRLGVPIRFTGYIPPASIHRMYHLGDVFVCPTRYREGFATVNSEAMASGVPVVASNRGGIREVVEHGRSGLLVNRYTSPAAFAQAITRIRQNPGLAKQLAHNGRRRVLSRFSWYYTVRRLKAQYALVRRRR